MTTHCDKCGEPWLPLKRDLSPWLSYCFNCGNEGPFWNDVLAAQKACRHVIEESDDEEPVCVVCGSSDPATVRLLFEQAKVAELTADNARMRSDWTNALFEAVELGTLLKESHKYVCSLLCPSVWHTDSPPQHCALCVRIATALAKHEGIDT